MMIMCCCFAGWAGLCHSALRPHYSLVGLGWSSGPCACWVQRFRMHHTQAAAWVPDFVGHKVLGPWRMLVA